MANYDKFKKKYHLKKETEKYATFEIPKKFNWTAFLVLSLVFNIFGLIGYLIYYNTRPDISEKTIWKKKKKSKQ